MPLMTVRAYFESRRSWGVVWEGLDDDEPPRTLAQRLFSGGSGSAPRPSNTSADSTPVPGPQTDFFKQLSAEERANLTRVRPKQPPKGPRYIR